jgi:broad specificity phosphatase PhoE
VASRPGKWGARVDRVIARARALDRDILFFSHGLVLRVLAARWISLPPAGGQHFLLDTGTLCVLSYYRCRRCEFGTGLSWTRANDFGRSAVGENKTHVITRDR